MSADVPISDDDDLLAAELAFDLLDEEDRHSAAERARTDDVFASALARWQDRAAGLLPTAIRMPRPSLWAAIERNLPGSPFLVSRRTLRWWQGATAAASLLAASLLVIVAVHRSPPARLVPVSPLYVAVLTGHESEAVVAVTIDAKGQWKAAPGALTLKDRVPELWVIAKGSKPRALGVIASDRRSHAVARPEIVSVVAPGATLAISVEPVGGSPTGQPTGPVILTGTVAAA